MGGCEGRADSRAHSSGIYSFTYWIVADSFLDGAPLNVHLHANVGVCRHVKVRGVDGESVCLCVCVCVCVRRFMQ